MNKEAYLLGYKRSSLKQEDFVKTAYLYAYEKKADIDMSGKKYVKAGVWGSINNAWDKTKDAVSGYGSKLKKNFDPTALYSGEAWSNLKPGNVVPALTHAVDPSKAINKTVEGITGAPAAFADAASSSLTKDVGGFLKDNWMPLVFGGLALGGAAMGMFGGNKGQAGAQGAQTYAGPQGPQPRQGNWQTYNPQVYGNQ